MKILFIHDRPRILGGAVIYLAALRAYLEGRGHECRVVGFGPDVSGPSPAGEVLAVPRRRRGSLASKAVRKLDLDPALYAGIRRVIASTRPDLVHVHNFLGGGNAVLPACRGLPTVLTVHDVALLCPLDGRCIDARGRYCADHFGPACVRRGCLSPRVFLEHLLLRESLRRLALRRWVQRVFVHSRYLADRIETLGLHPTILPRFVDLQGFPFVPLEGQARHRVLFVGHLDVSKGLEVLLRAFRLVHRRIPSARLDVVGEGPRKEVYLEEATALGLAGAVRFHGEVEHRETAAFYQGSAVTAIPSQSPETGPFTALEAMSTGRPVVASRIGALPEIVREGRTGHLVPPGSVEETAERLVSLLQAPETAAAMGREARKEAEQLARLDPFSSIEEHYQELVTRQGRPRKRGGPS